MKNARVPEFRIVFDLFVEDSWRSVYAGELEVRPPGAPTTAPRLRSDVPFDMKILFI